VDGAHDCAELEPQHAADTDARNVTSCCEPMDGPWVKAENVCDLGGVRQRCWLRRCLRLSLLHPFLVADTTVVDGDIQSFVA